MNVGVIDSGVGGLTILYDLIKNFPYNNYYYLGDSANCPYGVRDEKDIKQLSKKIVTYLINNYKIDILVIACNTISSVACAYLKELFPNVKIIGMIEPTAFFALSKTINNRVGIIATSATINSKKYDEIIKDRLVYSSACPFFVNMAEKGKLNIKDKYLINRKMRKINKEKVDTLILGCTHFPLLIPYFKKIYKKKIVTSNEAIIKELSNIINKKEIKCEVKIITTIDSNVFEKQIQEIFKRNEIVEKIL